MTNLLIVDDNSLILKLLADEFKDSNINVVTASDGHEALMKVNEGNIDAILLDLFMPNMDGLQFLENLNHNDSRINIMVMSGSSNPEIKTTLNKKGIHNIFLKPLSDDDFKSILSLLKSG